MEVLNEYLAFLWNQFQYDWSILSTPWILYTVLPAVSYLVFFTIKWWVLLVPVTLPVTILSGYFNTDRTEDRKDKFKDEFTQLLKKDTK